MNSSISSNPSPDEIREARVKAGLTQEQAADLVHVDRTSWFRWESEKGAPHHRQMNIRTWELFKIKLREK